ncbi:MAG: flavin reductase [Alphaproteobacteria bacterium]|nr:MAG: flavin reductase [Alphaproteobacteria bacterium]
MKEAARIMTRHFDVRAFRTALGQFATGVTIITAYGEDGAPFGMTANSFSSLSLDPPLVLWSIDKKATLFDAFERTSGYMVNVLSAQQQALCGRFAQRNDDPRLAKHRFDGIATDGKGRFGPRLAGSLAAFDCAVEARIDGGDHRIVIGRVDDFVMQANSPLVFFAGRLTTLPPA